MRSAALLCLTCLVVAALVAGCPQNPGGTNNPNAQAKLRYFSSEGEFLDYFHGQADRALRGDTFGFGVPLAVPTVAEDSTSGGSGAATTEDAGGAADFSTTNLQEAGVDESDVVKSDGEYFYIARDQSLRIVKAAPASELAEVARLDLDFWISELYVSGDNLILLGNGFDNGYMAIEIWPPYYSSAKIEIQQVDITDRANPVASHRASIDGSLVTTRLLDNRLVLVTTVVPELPAMGMLGMPALASEDVMPTMTTASGTQDVVSWDHWLRPDAPNGYYGTTIMTLDADNVETVIGSTALVANAGIIYATTDAVFISDTDYDPSDNYRETTQIHKFRFDENKVATYVASGEIDGRPLNQFSLGEFEGDLRIATHISPTFSGGGTVAVDAVGSNVSSDGGSSSAGSAGGATGTEQDRNDTVSSDETPTEPVDSPPATSVPDTNQPSNAVYVLRENGEKLDVVGKVEGIAPGESLYAARFLGTRAYLVTFLRIDPLFVVDLSDPTGPQLTGELEVPGYSDYLHPLSEDRLLGVGRSVADNGFGGVTPSALQLSLFDVSDLANPTLIQQIQVGGPGSYSSITETHKAFTYLESTHMLAVPAYLTGETADTWYTYVFQGVLCYQVDSDAGFTELGRLSAAQPTDPNDGCYGYWWWSWQRASIIDDTIYSLSQAGVSAAQSTDFTVTQEVTFQP